MARKFVEQKITKWWHAFTELKSWVQIAIAIVLVVIVHNYVLHQTMAKKKKKAVGLTTKQKKLPKALQMAILKKQKNLNTRSLLTI